MVRATTMSVLNIAVVATTTTNLTTVTTNTIAACVVNLLLMLNVQSSCLKCDPYRRELLAL